ncbi:MAG: phage protease, partial [Sphaerospermopsis kisseleviana]
MGYEPPLFLGHPTDNTTVEGAPSVAFLEKLYQESDTLYGLYDPVDDKAYQEAAKGAYRYSSAEVSRNAVSKKTGQSIGTVLRGAALTNRPFLTGMPRVEAVTQQFSESVENNLTILFPLTTEKEMTTTTTQLENTEADLQT